MPIKTNDTVRVKRAGNFGRLVVVKIMDDFQFGARMADRKILRKGEGQFAKISWNNITTGEPDQAMHWNFPIKKVLSKNKNSKRPEYI